MRQVRLCANGVRGERQPLDFAECTKDELVMTHVPNRQIVQIDGTTRIETLNCSTACPAYATQSSPPAPLPVSTASVHRPRDRYIACIDEQLEWLAVNPGNRSDHGRTACRSTEEGAVCSARAPLVYDDDTGEVRRASRGCALPWASPLATLAAAPPRQVVSGGEGFCLRNACANCAIEQMEAHFTCAMACQNDPLGVICMDCSYGLQARARDPRPALTPPPPTPASSRGAASPTRPPLARRTCTTS